mgnify:CR=1 FL=1
MNHNHIPFTIIVLLLFGNIATCFAQTQTDIFGKYLDEAKLESSLISDEQWTPFDKDSKIFKESVSDSIVKILIANGEKALDYSWPTLTATLMLEFSRTGNRSHYQNLHFERRDKLKDLVIAEFLEDEGRFCDQIANGVWAICEESYWGVPAHLYLQSGERSLANIEEPTVDLFAAETGSLLAWTHYLLEGKLEQVSPILNQRIKKEIENRILIPNLEREDFWWMGYDLSKDQRVNNWNPWIVSNWLTTALFFEDNKARRTQTVLKILKVLGHFVNRYPSDGGCDEGPSYWGHAGASLFDCLELLYSATDGTIDVYNEPLIENIGSYIFKAYIGKDYFVNFADATAKLKPNADLIYRFGKRTNNTEMQKFGAYLYQENKGKLLARNLFRVLNALKNEAELSKANKEFEYPIDVWLEESEVMMARSNKKNKGFFLAAKAGHNAESHNHNDVGNFIVYYNASPVLIDAGVGTYTAKTFSNERYNLWNMQSAYHNLPKINGYMQEAGRNFSASEISYKSNNKFARLKLNLAKAYPYGASVNSWDRTIQINRNKNIVLTEKYDLKESLEPNTLSLITPCQVTITEPGEIRLNFTESGKKLSVYLNYDAISFLVEQKQINLEGEENERLRQIWKEGLTRIILKEKTAKKRGNWKFLLSSY